MFTPNTEEQQFMELGTKFRDELSHVDKQIGELQERREQLLHILYGPGPVLAEESVPEEPALAHSATVVEEPISTALSPDSRVLRFIRRNQETGTSRTQINELLSRTGLEQSDIDKLLKRLRTAGKIVSEGNARAARWYIAE
jgi:predicted Rossmann fold nucleotide-binding protein DprA/Smf involved in DNA uptake